jgi:mono/diheme cytochrome c family protein
VNHTEGMTMLSWMRLCCLGLAMVGILFAPWVASTAAVDEAALISRGKDVFAAAGGCGCHTAKDGKLNAGGRKLAVPFGVVYSTNITPDRKTGIGAWTEEQFVEAMRHGVRPNGDHLLPVMPYPAFRGMAVDDMRALWAYLRSLPPVRQPTKPPELKIPFSNLWMPVWNLLYGGTGKPPAEAPASGVERGEYLVKHVAHCGECHTPRNFMGAPKTDKFLAGTEHGPENAVVPNITPDSATGIGDWDGYDIAFYLETGIKPNGDNAQGLMDRVIEGTSVGYKDLTQEDLDAIAAYLRIVPHIVNKISRR